jgi:hypothetical protein
LTTAIYELKGRRRARHNEAVDNSPPLLTLKRRLDEPRLALGDAVDLKDGAQGIVIVRYTPSAHPDEIRYIVRVESKNHGA